MNEDWSFLWSSKKKKSWFAFTEAFHWGEAEKGIIWQQCDHFLKLGHFFNMEGGNSIFFPRHYQIQSWQIFRFSHLLNIYTYFFSDFKYILETETSLFFVKYRTVRHFPPSDSFLKAILKNRITAYLGSKAREGFQKLFAFLLIFFRLFDINSLLKKIYHS